MSHHTISQLLTTHSLPLLVHDHNSNQLLLHKSVRIPYVICQRLDSQTEHNSYFLIPLDNTGYYGGVSSDDNSPPAYHCLQDLLLKRDDNSTCSNSRLTKGDNSSTQILTCTKLNAQQISDDRSQQMEVEGGTVIIIPNNQSCNLLDQQNSRKQSNCAGKKKRKRLICCRVSVQSGTSNHVHIDHLTSGLFYIVSDGKSGLKMGNAHIMQDITHSQEMPVTVSKIYHRKSVGDEISLPQVFRLIKIISQKIVVAYQLNRKFSPLPEHAVEIFHSSSRKYKLSDDHSVNMSEIKHHRHQMSIKIAQPGDSIEAQDYHDIMVRSISLPPKLPTRPPSIEIHDDTTPNVHYKEQNYQDDIKLPQKIKPSLKQTIMKKFNTLKPQHKQRASLTNLQTSSSSSDKITDRRIPKKSKSLRDLPISRPVIIDLFNKNSTPETQEPTVEHDMKLYDRLESPNAYHISPIMTNYPPNGPNSSTKQNVIKRVSYTVSTKSTNSKSSGISSAAEEALHSLDQMITEGEKHIYDPVATESDDDLPPDSVAPLPIYTGYLTPRPLSHTSTGTRDNWF